MIVGATGYVVFDVYAASSCEILSCGTPTNNIACIDYAGQTSGQILHDSSGYMLAGCLTQGPISNVITGSCDIPTDTILVNYCPSTTVTLPIARYAGYSFYSAMHGDNVDDNMDWDLDGIPNQLDRDCDNDGIPDAAESFGVDQNGDGIIDNYSDTDNDGLSQNVDGNNTGAVSSGLGLGAIDTDGDGVPNYLDLDSDNDGIPDIIEAY
jgi:hypothetical protein